MGFGFSFKSLRIEPPSSSLPNGRRGELGTSPARASPGPDGAARGGSSLLSPQGAAPGVLALSGVAPPPARFRASFGGSKQELLATAAGAPVAPAAGGVRTRMRFRSGDGNDIFPYGGAALHAHADVPSFISVGGGVARPDTGQGGSVGVSLPLLTSPKPTAAGAPAASGSTPSQQSVGGSAAGDLWAGGGGGAYGPNSQQPMPHAAAHRQPAAVIDWRASGPLSPAAAMYPAGAPGALSPERRVIFRSSSSSCSLAKSVGSLPTPPLQMRRRPSTALAAVHVVPAAAASASMALQPSARLKQQHQPIGPEAAARYPAAAPMPPPVNGEAAAAAAAGGVHVAPAAAAAAAQLRPLPRPSSAALLPAAASPVLQVGAVASPPGQPAAGSPFASRPRFGRHSSTGVPEGPAAAPPPPMPVYHQPAAGMRRAAGYQSSDGRLAAAAPAAAPAVAGTMPNGGGTLQLRRQQSVPVHPYQPPRQFGPPSTFARTSWTGLSHVPEEEPLWGEDKDEDEAAAAAKAVGEDRLQGSQQQWSQPTRLPYLQLPSLQPSPPTQQAAPMSVASARSRRFAPSAAPPTHHQHHQKHQQHAEDLALKPPLQPQTPSVAASRPELLLPQQQHLQQQQQQQQREEPITGELDSAADDDSDKEYGGKEEADFLDASASAGPASTSGGATTAATAAAPAADGRNFTGVVGAAGHHKPFEAVLMAFRSQSHSWRMGSMTSRFSGSGSGGGAGGGTSSGGGHGHGQGHGHLSGVTYGGISMVSGKSGLSRASGSFRHAARRPRVDSLSSFSVRHSAAASHSTQNFRLRDQDPDSEPPHGDIAEQQARAWARSRSLLAAADAAVALGELMDEHEAEGKGAGEGAGEGATSQRSSDAGAAAASGRPPPPPHAPQPPRTSASGGQQPDGASSSRDYRGKSLRHVCFELSNEAAADDGASALAAAAEASENAPAAAAAGSSSLFQYGSSFSSRGSGSRRMLQPQHSRLLRMLQLPKLVTAPPEQLPPGMARAQWRLEDYDVMPAFYQGDASYVYQATCLVSGEPVVLKAYDMVSVAESLPPDLAAAWRAQLGREVALHTAAAGHASVIKLFGAFQEEGLLVLVLERADGGDLFTHHRSLPDCRMPEEEVTMAVLVPLLRALVFLHGRGIVHRDIKPENLLLDAEGTLKLTDFGAAISAREERPVTRTGTAEYMAPEVTLCLRKDEAAAAVAAGQPLPNRGGYGFPVDIWGVGILAYELLVGRPPDGRPPQAGGSSGGAEGPSKLHLAGANVEVGISNSDYTLESPNTVGGEDEEEEDEEEEDIVPLGEFVAQQYLLTAATAAAVDGGSVGGAGGPAAAAGGGGGGDKGVAGGRRASEDAGAEAGGSVANGGGSVGGSPVEKRLHIEFPSHVSHPARAFIRAALAVEPADRPTAAQLLQHPWLRAAAAAAAAGAAVGTAGGPGSSASSSGRSTSVHNNWRLG
ncbi:hypothetical protein HYH02_003260 [Chlamydomonas schloesseri]|uniref:Protein kinase domain-containing protein n=1 Tax=Chlamydomonas schloesseri TaxID=2026947 RepID=A0A835WQV5_9CHLO|nr:hypothetical protein HYH02_003260 [Chlamydomonas schloesseri]|eukprot:KAG2452232.1 hypothetical protein HYH02_003260 [Chlamydomonas schloesseri]